VLQLLEPPLREVFARHCGFECLELAQIQHSKHDGASKILFRTPNDQTVEGVILRIDSGRTSFCVSSATGCSVGCRFCATAKLPQATLLSAGEIVDQVVQANQLLLAEDRYVRNVVFMGMGEPLLNEKNVHAAVHILCQPHLMNLSENHVVVSTVGIPDAMRRFAKAYPRVRLALSLHTADQTTREALMPIARQFPLDDLRQTLLEVNRIQKQSVMIEYLMLNEVTDTDDDIDRLDAFLTGLDVHVNLLPFHDPGGQSDLQPSHRERREAFAAELKRRGYKTTLRYSLGADIDAACGQLARKTAPTTPRPWLQ
jgi:23S rRNA (adenine2503-C2)-methyltransferase